MNDEQYAEIVGALRANEQEHTSYNRRLHEHDEKIEKLQQTQIQLAVFNNINCILLKLIAIPSDTISQGSVSVSGIQESILRNRTNIRLVFSKDRFEDLIEKCGNGIPDIMA
jgi:hypothetical protein